jgi:hypothetical protein
LRVTQITARCSPLEFLRIEDKMAAVRRSCAA